MNDTELPARRPLTEILTDLADFTVASTGTKAIKLYHELEDAVRAELAPLPEGEAERMAEQAERAARTMAPPVPGVTRNAGYIVRAVIYDHPHANGLLEAWWVAAEHPDGRWVTWHAYKQDGSRAGTLSYDAGHYYDNPVHSEQNKRAALADWALRAGLMIPVAQRIADQILADTDSNRYPYATPDKNRTENRRMARRLRQWAAR